MRTRHLFIVLVLLALALPAPHAQAGGVVTVCDEAHLLAALAGGGTVTFACSGTIILTSTITIVSDTTIDGSGQSVTINGNRSVQVLRVDPGITLNLNRLTIADGIAPDYSAGGGAIQNNSGVVTVSNCTFTGNRAGWPGGGVIRSIGPGAEMTVTNSTFTDNWGLYGGGIYNVGEATVLIVNNSIFSNNEAWQAGGGIYNEGEGAIVTVSRSAFFDNSATVGGGIANTGAATISNSTFLGNTADSSGGGISSGGTGASVDVSASTLSENYANFGGGIYNSLGVATMNNSTVTGNRSDYSGGGMYSYDGVAIISTSTFSGNEAGQDDGGGGIYTVLGVTMLRNTIVANNLIGQNCSGVPVDGGGNLSYPDTTCPGINLNPRLYPLQDNGGPTMTMALGPGSGALDAGNDAVCAAPPVNNLDQRGHVRPKGSRCDIGAVEQDPYPTTWFPLALRR